jgi:protein CpxP
MREKTGGPLRAAFAFGLGAALLAAPFGVAGGALAADSTAPLQLAQAAQGGPRPAAAPQAQPGGADQGTEKQLAELQRRLKVTPEQQPKFDAFAQGMRQNAQEMDALNKEEQQKRTRNAVEELQSAARFSEAEATGLKRLVPMLQALYDSLSDQQKRTADQLLGSSAPEPAKGKRR